MENRDRDEERRPSPDQLLTLVQKEGKRQGRGHLKIFLGMVAGVGKTYAMLQRAHQLKDQGVDVAVGWIDTHGRKETEGLVEGLEVLPRLTLSHRGIQVTEMDLDAILKRRPKVVIVDELAHTNVPGSRHQKRYLDVLEILKAGIDVFTAVNIQHLESRVDTVKEITGISVQETIPDSLLDEADEVALIDLPPEDLLMRLKEGRIYGPERAAAASDGFFSLGNLTALRELALKTATERVDRDLRDFKTLHGIEDVWKSSSRLMVAVFGSPYSDSLIRWTRQLADTMRGTWIGVHVATESTQSELEKRLLEKNMELVRLLGGEVVSIQDQDLVDGILKVARQQNVTQIIVGKTQRGFWRNLLSGGSVVNRLLRKSGEIDVYAVSTDNGKPTEHRKLKGHSVEFWFPWGEMGGGVGVILASWLIAEAFKPFMGYESTGTLFLIAVTLSGLFFSRIVVFCIAVALSLINNFFFIPPLYTFTIDKPKDALMFLMYFVAAGVVGHLTTRLRHQNRIIQGREDKAVELFKLAHAIAESKDLDRVSTLGVETVGRIFSGQVAVIFVPDFGKPLIHPSSTYRPDEKELGVAQWVKTNGMVAGRFTDTLPAAAATYFPISTKGKILGAIAIQIPANHRFDFEKKNFAHALVGQINAGIEREQLHESRKRLEVLEQADKLYRSLFDSVSHELKTPLTTIKGAASALLGKASESSQPTFVEALSSQVATESERLLEVVDNMLDMTRIESGALRPSLQVADVADVLGPSLKKLGGMYSVTTSVAEGLPPLHCDPTLTVQALTNILKNAFAYAGATPRVHLRVAKGLSNTIEFQISDNGPGLPKEEPNRVFDRFYRENPGRAGGVGLGLSIAKGFIEVQGGTILAANGPDGGAIFTIRLTTT